ncbi:MAG: hypothetical protein IPL65_09650 [Lewinellaceae bacterium]|nr:hypothetical protein [Lewinellaceae bacterium]
MTTFKKVFLLLPCLSILLLYACDPAQNLLVVNKSNADASITFILNPNSQRYRFPEIQNTDTLTIQLDTSRANSEWRTNFGIGTWKIQSSFDSLVNLVTRIEIRTPHTQKAYNTPAEIHTFFENRITGSRKETIEIELK